MATITIHSSPPSLLTAGDVYNWKETPADIADVSSMVYTFRSLEDSDNDFSVTGSDQTTYFLFDLQGSVTTALDGAEYTVTRLVTYTWGRETEACGKMVLLDNPSNDPTKSFNQRMVELLETYIEGRLPEGIESYTIGGVPITKIGITEARDLLADYKNRVEAEKNRKQKQANPGLASGNTVKIHF